jgi:hypothetical protein
VLITPKSEVLLVQPKRALANGWIFPQRRIERQESLLEAAKKAAEVELGYSPQVLDSKRARYLGKGRGGAAGKEYFVVAIPMNYWRRPDLNEENRKFCTVGGPGELMQKISDCSQAKKQLIQVVLNTTIERGALFSSRWKSANVDAFLGSS